MLEQKSFFGASATSGITPPASGAGRRPTVNEVVFEWFLALRGAAEGIVPAGRRANKEGSVPHGTVRCNANYYTAYSYK